MQEKVRGDDLFCLISDKALSTSLVEIRPVVRLRRSLSRLFVPSIWALVFEEGPPAAGLHLELGG